MFHNFEQTIHVLIGGHFLSMNIYDASLAIKDVCKNTQFWNVTNVSLARDKPYSSKSKIK